MRNLIWGIPTACGDNDTLGINIGILCLRQLLVYLDTLSLRHQCSYQAAR
jgi:hypothetical protein